MCVLMVEYEFYVARLFPCIVEEPQIDLLGYF